MESANMIQPSRVYDPIHMIPSDLLRRRLENQRVTSAPLRDAAAVVGWLGAVQAQDYAAGKWALGLRSRGGQDAQVEQALDAREILRTHRLRPTRHFVLAGDIRWMLPLTAPPGEGATPVFNPL